jgi:L-aminopeptidase/D-esterase-like protein
VHLPGSGWRGYDPGHGGAVANAHVAAACNAADAAPIEGSFYGAGAGSSLEYELDIKTRP